MNLSHDALKDVTAHAEFKAKGGIFERHLLLPLKGHAVSDRHVDVPSLEGFRTVSYTHLTLPTKA